MAMATTFDALLPWLLFEPHLGFRLDLSSMGLTEDYFQQMKGPLQRALAQMHDLEGGSLSNPDEGRFVGHYWLRAPSLSPDPQMRAEIDAGLDAIQSFVAAVHEGTIKPPKAPKYTRFLQVGIGGSALGPQLVQDALRSSHDRLAASFLDNTDPDGIDRLIDEIQGELPSTLVLIVSKSGGTKETRNGMVEIKEAMQRIGLSFEAQAVAVTMPGSALEKQAASEGWLRRFPLWDWVGGRTSLFSAVGLLPAALQGIDVHALLSGAKAMDRWTREADPRKNPAALLALAWFFAGEGRGSRDMVVLPYKDRLLLLSRYLQQLVMESLGKKVDLEGRIVHQGIVVYGNKGSTDQHAFVQQLREGPDNFFVTFIEVLKDRQGEAFFVEPAITSGDYLLGFLLGTRQALAEAGRSSATITLPDVSAHSLAGLIALYERAVGLYAFLVGINAYHQPGVEAGKKAAGQILLLQGKLLDFLKERSPRSFLFTELAEALAGAAEPAALFSLLEHLAANHRLQTSGQPPHQRRYQALPSE